MYPWTGVGLGLVLPLSIALSNLMLQLTLLTWLLAKPRPNSLRHPLTQWCGMLLILYLLGFVVGEYANWHGLQKISRFLYLPLYLPIFAQSHWRRRALQAWFVAIILTVVLGALKHYGFSVIGHQYAGGAVFKDSIHTSLMMALSAYCLAQVICFSHSRSWYWYVLLGAIGVFMICWNVGRSGQIVLACLIGLFLYQHGTWRQRLVGILVVSVLSTGAWFEVPFFRQRWQAAYQEWEAFDPKAPQHTSLGERLEFAYHSWQLLQQRPWFGWGTGGFAAAYAQRAEVWHISPTRNPHNEYLHVGLQLGLLGLGLWLALGWRLWHLSSYLAPFERYMVQGVLLSFALGCLANSWLTDSTSNLVFIFTMAMAYGSLPRAEYAARRYV